jgi:uncharacterized membrane protein
MKGYTLHFFFFYYVLLIVLIFFLLSYSTYNIRKNSKKCFIKFEKNKNKFK